MVSGNREGTFFAVWAPNAEKVLVIGDFNNWGEIEHPLTPKGTSGIWEGFIPGVQKGDLYKYRIFSRGNGYQVDKADPFAFYSEGPPRMASRVWDLWYTWEDTYWMSERNRFDPQKSPISIYEVHLGSWRHDIEEGRRPLTYQEAAPL